MTLWKHSIFIFHLSMKLNNRSVPSSRSKDQETWRNTILNKERDKLLQEFLLAREELKAQFDVEKREIVGNYERRMRYLRKLLEDCDENINMLKLNLDAEKEENFILKTRIMELERQTSKQNEVTPNKNEDVSAGYLNQSFDNQSVAPTSCNCSRNNSTRKSSYRTCTTVVTPERSSIGGLKYSDRFASCGSIGQDSCFTSISTISTVPSCCVEEDDAGDMHANCRKEFNLLLDELRSRQEKYNIQLDAEKERMKEQIQDEKLQLERVVYRQLNVRLEREVKKQELLFTENAHLRRTISNAIMERMQCECRNNKPRKKVSSTDRHWKESNSDSGADVEDNRSDDGSDESDSGKGSFTSCSNGKFQSLPGTSCEDILKPGLINKLIMEPLRSDRCDASKNEKAQFSSTITTTSSLKNELNKLQNICHVDNQPDCLEEVSEFKEELRKKLLELEEILMSDDGEC